MADAPDPGTPEAIDRGCSCAIIDNHHGKGYRGRAGEFVFDFACPLHNPQPLPKPAPSEARP